MNIALIVALGAILGTVVTIATFVRNIMKQEREKGAMAEKNNTLSLKVAELDHKLQQHEEAIHKNDVSHEGIQRMLDRLDSTLQEVRTDMRELKDKFDRFIKG